MHIKTPRYTLLKHKKSALIKYIRNIKSCKKLLHGDLTLVKPQMLTMMPLLLFHFCLNFHGPLNWFFI